MAARRLSRTTRRGDAAEEFEGGAVQAQPGLDRLVEDQLGGLMPAAGQRQHEDPGASHPPTLGIQELASEAEVDLRLLPGRDLDPESWPGPPPGRRGGGSVSPRNSCRQSRAPRPAAARWLAPRDATRVQGDHALAQGLDQRLLVGRPLGRRPLQQHGQGRGLRHLTAVEHAVPGGPEPVVSHRVGADAEVAGDAPIGLAQVQPSQDLADVGHRTPPSRHSSPPQSWGAPSRILRGGEIEEGIRSRPAGWLHMAAPGWLSMGDPAWLRMGDPGWLSFPDPGGSVWGDR